MTGEGFVDSRNRVSYGDGINTKESSVLNRFGRYAQQAHGVGGAAARAITKLSSATYRHAGQKLYQNRVNPRTGASTPSAMKRFADFRKSMKNYADFVNHPHDNGERSA